MNEILPELHDLGKLVDGDTVARQLIQTPDPQLPLTEQFRTMFKPAEHVKGHTLDWLDWDAAVFADLRDNPNARLLREHHDKGDTYEKLPQTPVPDLRWRKQMLLTTIADHIASTFSRAVEKQDSQTEADFAELRKAVPPERRRLVLWQDKKSKTSYAIQRAAELIELLALLRDPTLTPEKLFKLYQDRLEWLPEDAGAPRNVTSLLAHLMLVGKTYRFVADYYATALHDNTALVLDHKDKVRTLKMVVAWRMTLATIHIRIPQQPVRVPDLYVFRRQEQVLNQLQQENPNQILFYTNDAVWMMLPDATQAQAQARLAGILRPLNEAGLWAEARSLHDVNLRAKQVDVQRLRWQDTAQNGITETSIYGELAKGIDPPLCSICQIRPATKVWPQDSIYPEVRQRGGTPEDLCDSCFKIRDIPARERFKQLAKWHPEDLADGDEHQAPANIKTAWLKLTLDYDMLIEYLGHAFNGYLDSLDKRLPNDNPSAALARHALQVARQDFNPLALMADFTEEYRRLTVAFNTRLLQSGWEYESIREKDYRDFFVVRVKNGADVLQLLQWYGAELLDHFPDALTACPIRLSVNVSLTKYPFYEHWRYISAPHQAVNLQMPGIARVGVDAPEFMEFLTGLNLTDPRGELRLTRTYLEKLRASEVRTGGSRALLTAVLLSDTETKRIPHTLQPFIEMYQKNKITIQDILDWYKITTWGNKNE